MNTNKYRIWYDYDFGEYIMEMYYDNEWEELMFSDIQSYNNLEQLVNALVEEFEDIED